MSPVRLLGLGNEILADDAFGILAAQEVERRFPGRIEVAHSSAAGFDLMDHLLGARRLLVVDTIVTGRAKPGAISVFTADRVQPAAPVDRLTSWDSSRCWRWAGSSVWMCPRKRL